MYENRRVPLKELAAGLIGERAEELLDFAVWAGGVTLISREGKKVRIGMEKLAAGWETGDGGQGTLDGRPEKKPRAKKGGGGGKP